MLTAFATLSNKGGTINSAAFCVRRTAEPTLTTAVVRVVVIERRPPENTMPTTVVTFVVFVELLTCVREYGTFYGARSLLGYCGGDNGVQFDGKSHTDGSSLKLTITLLGSVTTQPLKL